MSERRSTWHKRCQLCKIIKSLCFCAEIKTFAPSTKISVIIHKKEKFLPSNTVNLLQRNIPSLELITRGEQNNIEKISISKDFHPLFLYPDEDSQELNDDFLKTIKKPIQLIVPDGTWRQAKKIKRRDYILNNITSIKLSGDFESIYTLRKQKFKNGLCTFEAVAKALGIIEKNNLESKLLEQFQIMNDRFQSTRPILKM